MLLLHAERPSMRTLKAHDDEERSSGDYQGADLDEVEDVIRALGPSNVRQLASMPSAQLRGLEGASDSEGADDASERSYGDTSDLDSSEGSEGPLTFCVNCTNELDPMQTQCPVSIGSHQHRILVPFHCSTLLN